MEPKSNSVANSLHEVCDEAELRQFQRTLGDVQLFEEVGRSVAENLREEQHRLEDDLKQLEGILEVSKTDTGSVGDVSALEKQTRETYLDLDYLTYKLEVWERDLSHRTVVALCTAFEAFLRDFLVERVRASPGRLFHYLGKQWALPEACSFQVLPDLQRDEVDRCVSKACKSFQGLTERVKEIYGGILGQRFWKHSDTELKRAEAAIELLFALRHEIVHRNGLGGPSYQNDVGVPWRSLYSISSKQLAPGLETILSAQETLEALWDSLWFYAKHIVGVHTRRAGNTNLESPPRTNPNNHLQHSGLGG